jgi:hypothetical protein
MPAIPSMDLPKPKNGRNLDNKGHPGDSIGGYLAVCRRETASFLGQEAAVAFSKRSF